VNVNLLKSWLVGWLAGWLAKNMPFINYPFNDALVKSSVFVILSEVSEGSVTY